MVTLTRPTTTTQIVGDTQAKPVSGTMSEAPETSSNDSRLDGVLASQVIVSDGKGGFYVQPDNMLEGHLYSFMIDDMRLAVMKEADGHVALYGISEE